jgi:hypothetical protein
MRLPCSRHLLIYWPAGDDHVCQEVSCEFGRGVNDVLLKRYFARLT